MRGVVCFSKKGKLSPRYVRPFRVIGIVGLVDHEQVTPDFIQEIMDTLKVTESLYTWTDGHTPKFREVAATFMDGADKGGSPLPFREHADRYPPPPPSHGVQTPPHLQH